MPPAVVTRRSKRAAALPADERRSAIIAATLPLVLEHADRVTTRQIADAAGVAEGTIFRVFADKDEVITAVVEAALDPAPLERAIESVATDRPLGVALPEVVTMLQQRVMSIWRLFSSLGSAYNGTLKRPFADLGALVSFFDRYRGELAVDPAYAGRLLRAMTMSATHPMLFETPLSPDEIATMFLHGVTRGRGPC